MSKTDKLILGLTGATILYIASMIDSRGPEVVGTCITPDGFKIYPVINHDCTQGEFHE